MEQQTLIIQIIYYLTFPSMARSNTAIAAIPPVKAGYWYCHSDFPFSVPSIPSKLFTHLFAAFADIKPNTFEVTFPDQYRVQFSTFTQTVQKTNENVKTLLSIGGFSFSFTTNFIAVMASHPNFRKSFIDSSIKVARSNDFHGLSLHWLYPPTAVNMTNFGSLLDEWLAAIDKEFELTGNDPLLLVAAVYYTPSTSPTVTYPVNQIARKLDWINVVAYDFYNPGAALSVYKTGPFAALRSPKINAETCGHSGVSAWRQEAVPTNKIVLGLPFYGAAWRLVDENNREIFAAAAGRAQSGGDDKVYINDSDGTLPYNQIRYFIQKHPGGRQDYSNEYVVDYFSAGNTWIGYNDIQSIRAKVRYAKDNKLLGYYAWHVGGDKQWTLSRAAFGEWPTPVLEQAAPAPTPTTDIGTGSNNVTDNSVNIGSDNKNFNKKNNTNSNNVTGNAVNVGSNNKNNNNNNTNTDSNNIIGNTVNIGSGNAFGS